MIWRIQSDLGLGELAALVEQAFALLCQGCLVGRGLVELQDHNLGGADEARLVEMRPNVLGKWRAYDLAQHLVEGCGLDEGLVAQRAQRTQDAPHTADCRLQAHTHPHTVPMDGVPEKLWQLWLVGCGLISHHAEVERMNLCLICI